MKKKSLNRIKQRDKKRNRFGMRVDDSARKLAGIKKRRILKGITPPGIEAGYPLAILSSKKKLKFKKRLGERRLLRRVDENGIGAKLKTERRISGIARQVKPLAAPVVAPIAEVALPKGVPAPDRLIDSLAQKAKGLVVHPKVEDNLQQMVKEGKIRQADLDAYLKQ